MKRKLSLSLFLGLGVLTGIAQQGSIDPKQGYVENADEVIRRDRLGEAAYTPMTSTLKVGKSRAAGNSNGVVLGTTYYDLMSNSSIDDRMWLNSDGSISAAFTMNPNNSTGFPDRGAGYLYYDGKSWTVNNPSNRIESERCGWPSVAVTKSGKEIIISHSTATDQLIMNYRSTKGTGNWTEVKDPNGAKAAGIGKDGYTLWPRMTVGGANGETLHMIALSEPEGDGTTFDGDRVEGIDGAILYSRSKDGGQTWDKKSIILPGLDSSKYDNFNADSYAITARGDVIAIAAFHRFGDLTVLKSTDNGDNWTAMRPLVLGFGKYTLGDRIVLDTVTTCDNAGDILIDKNDEIHLMFGTWTWTDDDTVQGANGHTYTTFPFMNGLNYWKESYGENGHKRLVNLIDQDGNPNNLNIVGGITGLTDYGSKSLNSYPVLASDASGAIYCTFMGVMEAGTAKSYNDGTHHYRHQFVIKSPDGGCTWGDPMDLTDDGSGYEECVYGTMASEVTDSVRVVYMEDLFPGTNVGPVGQNNAHSIVKNEIVYVSMDKNSLPVAPKTCLTAISGDRTLCPGDSVWLDAKPSCGSSYLWNTGATTSGIWVKTTGKYSCEITTPCGKITDSVEIAVPTSNGPGPNVSLTSDLNTLCPSGSQTTLRVSNSSIGTSGFYNWNGSPNATFADTFLISGPGTYTVKVTNCVGGATTESITIGAVTKAEASITGASSLCPGETTTLKVSQNPDGAYEWRKSGNSTVLSNSTSLQVTQTGTYIVDVSACSRQFTAKDSFKVDVEPAATANLTAGGSTTLCKGEPSLGLIASGQTGATFKWYDGSTGNTFNVNSDSVHTFGYYFHSYNKCGDSTKSNVLNVTVKDLPAAPTISGSNNSFSGAGTNGKWYFKKAGTSSWQDAGVTGDVYNPTSLKGGDQVAARTVDNGCESELSNVIDVTTSVLQLGSTGGLVNIYPNPSEGVVFVSFERMEANNLELTVRNMVGQEVVTTILDVQGNHKEEINLSTFESGMYLITISNGNEQFSHVLLFASW
jgi:hypothetical protein